MIPKKIHYCWFSGEKYPPNIKRCFQSWRTKLPDYEFVLWDSHRFNFDSVPFVKRCIDMHKWAFAADYIRLYAVYTEGGIYLDSDVEVLQSFDSVLNCKAFWGIDANKEQHYAFPEAAIFGAEAGCNALKEMMNFYETLPVKDINSETFIRLTNVFTPENRTILNTNGTPHLVTAPSVMESILSKYGFVQVNQNQILADDIHIYGQPVFLNNKLIDTPQTIAHHHNASSWFFTDRGSLFKFCHNHPVLMPIYKRVENIRKKITHNL